MERALIIGAGLTILGYLLLDELLHAARPALRRWGIRWFPQFGRLDWKVYAPIPLAFLMAILMRDGPLISIYVAAVGVLTSLYLIRRSRGEERAKIDMEVAKLAEAFRSIYKIRPSVFSALEEARLKVAQPLRTHVTAAVETFYITSSPKRAFAELRRRVDNPYLNQFLYILERSETARREAVLEALDDLIARLRRHEELRRATETNLTVITGQTQIILIISVLMMFAIALIDPLRIVYTGSLWGQLLFIGVATIGVYTAYRIDRKVISLKERVL